MFKLTDRIDEQVEAHLYRLRRNGWLTFKGADAVNLLRKVIHLPRAPILIAHCHSRLVTDPHDYEHFVPRSFHHSFVERQATVEGTLGVGCKPCTLVWAPDRVADTSGLYLSSVSTLAHCFPQAEVDAVKIPEIPL